MKKKLSRYTALVTILILMATSSVFATVPAEGFAGSDGIYVKAESSYYWEGRYSNDRVFAEYLAKELTGSYDNLTNYAVGGAFSGILTGSVAEGTDRSNWSTWLKGWGGIDQTKIFSKDVGGKADPKALYIISCGGNDSYTVSTLGMAGATQKSADNIVTMIDNLAAIGATDFMVTLQQTRPAKTQKEFTKVHREALQKAINTYKATHQNLSIQVVDIDPLYRDMDAKGMEAYGYKSWKFYIISDWVPAYGYAFAADDNSALFPSNKAEDIYGYGYYYSTDSGYYDPKAKGWGPDDFFSFDEYHMSGRSHKHVASYMLDKDITTDKGTFKKVYDGTPCTFAKSDLAKKTYTKIYTFGDSSIDSGKALEVTTALVKNRTVPAVDMTTFKDLKTPQWYSTYVNFALQKGFMKGAQDGVFAPNDKVTRAQFITILGRLAGNADASATSPAEASPFKDVKATDYYASHVNWAVEKGIINGTAQDSFGSNGALSRQDMAKIIGAYAKSANLTLATGSGSGVYSDDAAIADYAKTYVYSLSDAGLLKGSANGFEPTKVCTRAEIAKIISMLAVVK